MNTKSNAHIERFISHRAAGTLLQKRMFPNAKEITETVGISLAALSRFPRSEPATVVVIGDGHTPRTGAWIASNSAWEVTSVDPAMREREWGIPKLRSIRAKVQDTPLPQADRLLLVLPHAHVCLGDNWITSALSAARKEWAVISLPCCVQHRTCMGDDPSMVYADAEIISEKREIRVW